MKCAIVHYWLLGMRGGERVVEALCKLLPDADIFTLFYNPEAISSLIRSHQIYTSFLNPLQRFHRYTLPLMPMALESLDLRGYDLVISSESGPAKGVITSSETRHMCYCHSPMRYLWDLYPDYLHDWTQSSFKRALLALVSNYLRLWISRALPESIAFFLIAGTFSDASIARIEGTQRLSILLWTWGASITSRLRTTTGRLRTGRVQAGQRCRLVLHTFWPETESSRTWAGIQEAEGDGRSDDRVLRTCPRSRSQESLRPLPWPVNARRRRLWNRTGGGLCKRQTGGCPRPRRRS